MGVRFADAMTGWLPVNGSGGGFGLCRGLAAFAQGFDFHGAVAEDRLAAEDCQKLFDIVRTDWAAAMIGLDFLAAQRLSDLAWRLS